MRAYLRVLHLGLIIAGCKRDFSRYYFSTHFAYSLVPFSYCTYFCSAFFTVTEEAGVTVSSRWRCPCSYSHSVFFTVTEDAVLVLEAELEVDMRNASTSTPNVRVLANGEAAASASVSNARLII